MTDGLNREGFTDAQVSDDPGDGGPAGYLAAVVRNQRRHRAVCDVLRWFDYRHLPEDSAQRKVSHECAVAACNMLEVIDADDPELTRGLSRLLEAKDSLVRAAIAAERAGTAGQ